VATFNCIEEWKIGASSKSIDSDLGRDRRFVAMSKPAIATMAPLGRGITACRSPDVDCPGSALAATP
jgi:hypothetical protein